MKHPFDLNPEELENLHLDIEQSLSDEEAEQLSGGLTFSTQALGEEGGQIPPKLPDFKLPEFDYPSHLPPTASTYAYGEEGGATTLAIGEEGGSGIDPGYGE